MNWKKILYSIFTQMLPVMLGVYLGFALNNFGEAQKVKKQKDTFSEMLKNEIKQNQKTIKEVNEYHIQLSKDFNEIRESDDILKSFGAYNFKGLRPGSVNDSAFETGIQTGIIQEFELDLIQKLNRLYNLQKRYDTFNEGMLNSFMLQKFPETESEMRNAVIKVSMNMNDVKIFESNLNDYYTTILERMN